MRGARAGFKERIFENGIYKVISLIITLILWFTVLARRDLVVVRETNLELLLGNRLVLVSPVPPTVEFRIAGSRMALKKLGDAPLESLKIDLSQVEAGHRVVTIPENSLPLPYGAKVVGVSPGQLSVDLAVAESKEVGVEVKLIGGPEVRETLEVSQVRPSKIVIRGARETLAGLKYVSTLPVSLDGLSRFAKGGVIEVQTRLDSKQVPGIALPRESEVTIQFRLIKVSKNKTPVNKIETSPRGNL